MNTTTTTLADDYEVLAATLLDVVARAACDPLAKPFAALGAAAQVCQMAAQASPEMRNRLALAAVALVRELVPALLLDLPSPPDQAH